MMRKRITDDKIKELLKVVQLDYLVNREGGLEANNDWNDVLSGKLYIEVPWFKRWWKTENGHGQIVLSQASIRYSW